jgi:protoporphyrin/coproporphyrin ferrochelatase
VRSLSSRLSLHLSIFYLSTWHVILFCQKNNALGFLYNLFADPDIIRLPGPLAPLQPLIALFISKRRAPKSRAAYESIGGGSPILKYSKEQARLMCQALQQRHGMSNVQAYIGMRYWKPFTEEALEQIKRDQIEALVIVPLYPQFSISTSGSSLRILQEEFSKCDDYPNMMHTVISSWYSRPGYINAMCNLLLRELNSFTLDEIHQQKVAAPHLKTRHILFSAHGVPQSYIAAGDPYQGQIQECVAQIEARLKELLEEDDVQVHLSYQSRVGPVEWLRPYTDDVLPQLGADGVKNLVVVPISFVSEHIETLEEIDLEYRELAHESGIVNWRRCPALNTDPAFINDMADMVVDALQEPVQTVTEACVNNMVFPRGGDNDLERLGINAGGVQGVGAEGDLYSSSTTGGRQQQEQQQRQPSPISNAMESSSSLSSFFGLQETERLNARVAMIGVSFTILLELGYGKSLVNLFGLIHQ